MFPELTHGEGDRQQAPHRRSRQKPQAHKGQEVTGEGHGDVGYDVEDQAQQQSLLPPESGQTKKQTNVSKVLTRSWIIISKYVYDVDKLILIFWLNKST